MYRIPAIIENRNLTAEEWSALDPQPILYKSDLGFESDTGLFKIGDGISTWNELNYYCAKDNSVDQILCSTDNKDYYDISYFDTPTKSQTMYLKITFKYPVKYVMIGTYELNDSMFELNEYGYQTASRYKKEHIYRIDNFVSGRKYVISINAASANAAYEPIWCEIGDLYVPLMDSIAIYYSDKENITLGNKKPAEDFINSTSFDKNDIQSLNSLSCNISKHYDNGIFYIFCSDEAWLQSKRIAVNGIIGGFTFVPDVGGYCSNQSGFNEPFTLSIV